MLSRKLLLNLPRQFSLRFLSSEASENLSNFQTLKVIPEDHVYEVQLNAPEKLNALTFQTWQELTECFNKLNNIPKCRSIVLSANGKSFCAGIDLKNAFAKILQFTADDSLDIARKTMKISENLRVAQDGFTAIESCRKPVIVVIHGHCLGAGTSLITAADIRYCTADAQLSIKEVDVGLAADVGVLQRIQKVTGNDSLSRELVFTARVFNGSQAKEYGLVSRVFEKKDEMVLAAKELAKEIASKSPVAVQGSKIAMNYARNHSIQDSLEMMGYWNQAMLQTEDTVKSAMAMQSKKTPEYNDF
ncbi:hypothetical protein FO519_003125 [Halicephalobus sp. NKZ332]|nr:hypothetical protein FO519_003125 [Halicephalobus sp. NKZ332]